MSQVFKYDYDDVDLTMEDIGHVERLGSQVPHADKPKAKRAPRQPKAPADKPAAAAAGAAAAAAQPPPAGSKVQPTIARRKSNSSLRGTFKWTNTHRYS